MDALRGPVRAMRDDVGNGWAAGLAAGLLPPGRWAGKHGPHPTAAIPAAAGLRRERDAAMLPRRVSRVRPFFRSLAVLHFQPPWLGVGR